MSGLICAGDLYFDRFDANNNSTGLIRVGNATEFALQTEADAKSRISKQRATFGQALDTIYIPKPASLNVSLDDIDADNLALAFLGDAAKDAGAGGTVTDESVTLTQVGVGYQLAHSDVSAVTVIEDTETAPTTYVLGTDYTLIPELGVVTVIAGSALATAIGSGPGQKVKISYTWAASSGAIVTAGTTSVIRGRWVLNGTNKANGHGIIVDVFDAAMSPNSAVDFLADDFVTLQLTGTMNIPVGKSAPFLVRAKETA